MSKLGITFLRYSLGLIYIWFGILKPFGLSPAQELVENTVYWFDNPKTFVPILGWWEVVIGLTMCIKPLIRVSIFLLFIQMPGTFLPLILLPEVIFNEKKFLLKVKKTVKEYGYCVVVASEGIKNKNNKFIAASSTKDSFGHAHLGGVAPKLANIINTWM